MVVLKLIAFFWGCIAFILVSLFTLLPSADKNREESFLEKNVFWAILVLVVVFAVMVRGWF